MPHHLRKHPVTGAFYFRVAVPRACRAAIGKTEILHNLQTKDPSEARLLGYILSAKTIIKFRELRGMKGESQKKALSGLARFESSIEVGSDGAKVWTKADPNIPGDEAAAAQWKLDALRQLKDSGLLKSSAVEGGASKNRSSEDSEVHLKLKKCTLKMAADKYIESRRTKTFDAHRAPKLRKFVELMQSESFGRTYVHEVTKEDIDKYIKWIELEAPNIKNKEKGVGLSGKTINTYIDVMSSFFSWCQGRDYCRPGDKENPFYGQRVKADDTESDRDIFTAEDLKKIFAPTDYLKWSEKLPHCYWAPLIALYTGARLGEICGMTTNQLDVDPATGIEFIRFIGPLKNRSSKREIPLHARLKDLGFLDYVADIKKLSPSSKALFPYLDNPSKRVSDAFAKHLINIGIKSPEKVFHSFRHTHIQVMSRHEISPGARRRHVGHAAKDVHEGDYNGEKLPIAEHAKKMSLVDFDIDIGALKYSTAMFEDALKRKTTLAKRRRLGRAINKST